MKYKIYSNPKVEANEFHMKHGCSFCEDYVSKVINIPDTPSLICKGCLYKMMKALDEAMIEEIKTNHIDGRSEGA